MGVNASSVEKTYDTMRGMLHTLVPEFEIRRKSELIFEINRLKKERGAIILGHNYMEPALYHGVADIVGDSLELSRKAAEATADIIIFCGVRFMAETAKILNPSRIVLLPSRKGGCSLASSITGRDVRELRARFPGVPVVTYINTYAEVKAECDVCCTSGNAAKIVDSLPGDTVIFLPDEYLAQNVAKETGKKIIFPSVGASPDTSTPTMIGWRGRCEVHEKFTPDDIARARAQFPDVVILAHPECSAEVVDRADFCGSTSRMIQYVKDSKAPRFLLLTECSMGDNIIAENPGKDLVRMCSVRCPHMNEITLEEVRDSLLHTQHVIDLSKDVMDRARVSLERMLAVH